MSHKVRMPLRLFGDRADEARACAVKVNGPFASFDADSECYRRLTAATTLTAADVAHGAAGVGKAVLRIDRPGDELVARRTQICAKCEHAEMLAGVLRQCRICKCSTWAKIRNASEHCPLEEW